MTEAAEAATEDTPCCQVWMLPYTDTPCGRPIHPAPEHDESPVCLMHSRDPQKNDAFQKEFDAILKQAEERNEIAEFRGFVFLSTNYRQREFKAKCCFYWATFTQDADFRRARFTQGADFSYARFTQGAGFLGATFTQDTDFHRATFTQDADFSGATFTQDANFWDATFTQDADFSGATFTQNANFWDATFTQDADFWKATFTQDANFSGAAFAKEARFGGAKFLTSAAFRETIFRGDGKLEGRLKKLGLEPEPETDDTLPGPVFSLAQFSHPEAIVFYKTYLGQALFHNCDVSRVTFSSVEWRRRKPGGKWMVLEEEIDLKRDMASALRPGPDNHDERDYGLIAELYQQLKKNYDDRKDYWTAGDFHYGEMEMKRLHSRRKHPCLRWLHRKLGLVAWYKYASAYGESYLRPLPWLAGVLVLFALLYPLAGLTPAPSPPPSATPQASAPAPPVELSYRQFDKFVQAHPGPEWFKCAPFFGNSLMTTLSVGSLQREPRYEPSYPWGRLLALLQLVLTSTLLALFLLALRRQFRR